MNQEQEKCVSHKLLPNGQCLFCPYVAHPEVPEWDFEKDCACGEIALWCSLHKESARKAILDFIRNQTLEEAAHSLDEYDEALTIRLAQTTIRSLKQ